MIILPRLTKKDMEAFKNKKIILLGSNIERLKIFTAIFESLDMNNITQYICTKSPKVILKCKILDIKVFCESKNINFIDNDLIVQPVDRDLVNIQKQLDIVKKRICISDLSAGEIMVSFYPNLLLQKYKASINYLYKRIKWNRMCNDKSVKKLHKYKNPCIICLPPKTADFTLNYTFDKCGNVEYLNLFHRPEKINCKLFLDKFGMLKVITGLRDPIAQNLSMFYHSLSVSLIDDNKILGELDNKDKNERNNILDKNIELFKNYGDDIQVLWYEYLKRYMYTEDNIKKKSIIDFAIQNFVSKFSKYVVDITKYPFNKEKGYTIIKEGNIEVFVYQLEKLNNLVPELSEWVGVPFTELVRGNDASDKWIGDSYKQAQKEIEITQEYFDRCYNEPYVQHCYSQEDIEKFKARWRPHIKN